MREKMVSTGTRRETLLLALAKKVIGYNFNASNGNKTANNDTHESRSTETMPAATTNVEESENTLRKRAGRPKGSQNKKTITK